MEITSEIQHGRYGRPQRVKHLIHHFFRTLHCGWWLRELSISRQSCLVCMETTSGKRHGRYGRHQCVKHFTHHFFRTLHSGWWLRELSISRQSCLVCMEITSEIQHGRYGRPQRVKHLIHHFFRTLHSGWWLRELSISRQSCIFAWKPLAKYNTADTDGLNVSNTSYSIFFELCPSLVAPRTRTFLTNIAFLHGTSWKPRVKHDTADTDGINVSTTHSFPHSLIP